MKDKLANPSIQRLIKFLIVGGIAFLVDFAVTLSSSVVFCFDSPKLDKTLGFIAGTITAYIFNKRWTFDAKDSDNKLIPIIGLYAFSWFYQINLYSILVDNLGDTFSGKTISFLIAQLTATIINFLVQHFFIFKKTNI